MNYFERIFLLGLIATVLITPSHLIARKRSAVPGDEKSSADMSDPDWEPGDSDGDDRRRPVKRVALRSGPKSRVVARRPRSESQGNIRENNAVLVKWFLQNLRDPYPYGRGPTNDRSDIEQCVRRSRKKDRRCERPIFSKDGYGCIATHTGLNVNLGFDFEWTTERRDGSLRMRDLADGHRYIDVVLNSDGRVSSPPDRAGAIDADSKTYWRYPLGSDGPLELGMTTRLLDESYVFRMGAGGQLHFTATITARESDKKERFREVSEDFTYNTEEYVCTPKGSP